MKDLIKEMNDLFSMYENGLLDDMEFASKVVEIAIYHYHSTIQESKG